MLGSYGSDESIAAGPNFKNAGVPAIACSSTNPQVTNGNSYYFSTCFIDPFQAAVTAIYCRNRGYSKVAVITDDDEYAIGLGNYFVYACENKSVGIDVVAVEKINDNDQMIDIALNKIKNENPQFVFIPLSTYMVENVYNKAKSIDLECQFGGIDNLENLKPNDSNEGIVFTTFYNADYSVNDGEEAIFLRGNNVGETSTGFASYLTNVEKESANFLSVAALGYDAYLAAYKAIEMAQSTKGSDIRDALTKVSFEGATGAISFNSDGYLNRQEVCIKEIENGRFVLKDFVKLN